MREDGGLAVLKKPATSSGPAGPTRAVVDGHGDAKLQQVFAPASVHVVPLRLIHAATFLQTLSTATADRRPVVTVQAVVHAAS